MRSYLELRAPGPGDQELFVSGRGQLMTSKEIPMPFVGQSFSRPGRVTFNWPLLCASAVPLMVLHLVCPTLSWASQVARLLLLCATT